MDVTVGAGHARNCRAREAQTFAEQFRPMHYLLVLCGDEDGREYQ